MPTYEYACTACGHRLEAVQKFTDDALTDCPECGGALRKVYGAVGIAFKGSGFYKTDSRADGKKKSAATVPAAADSSSSDSKSSDSTSTSTSSDSATKTSTDKPAAKESKDTKKAAATAS